MNANLLNLKQNSFQSAQNQQKNQNVKNWLTLFIGKVMIGLSKVFQLFCPSHSDFFSFLLKFFQLNFLSQVGKVFIVTILVQIAASFFSSSVARFSVWPRSNQELGQADIFEPRAYLLHDF